MIEGMLIRDVGQWVSVVQGGCKVLAARKLYLGSNDIYSRIRDIKWA
jgi:hypothetical protein